MDNDDVLLKVLKLEYYKNISVADFPKYPSWSLDFTLKSPLNNAINILAFFTSANISIINFITMLDNYKKIPVKTTYMKMTENPNFEFEERKWVSLTHFDKPNINLYKDVYKRIGEKWGWTGRLILSDEELKEKIHHENTEFYCLFEKENLVGFFELDKNLPSEVEIIYLGLVPEYIGKGFGKLLLKLAIDKAWGFEPNKIWLHTCEFDHKNAQAIYEKFGFKPYKSSIDQEYYPLDFLDKQLK